MRAWSKAVSVGVALGVALFVAFGLISFVAAHPGASDLKAGPIDKDTIRPAEDLGKAFAMVAAHVRPAVVRVYSEKTLRFQAPGFEFPFGDDFFQQFFGRQFPQNQPRGRSMPREYKQGGLGSGMIIDKQGHILTNYHVVRDADDIKVQLADKRSFEAEVVSSDPLTDVAVIRLKGKAPEDLPTVEFGDSDAIEVGDLVMAIGAPFGYVQTVTTGIISAKGRSSVVNPHAYEDFLQTDAAINPGNSGGPLVNMRGEVIGINSAIATSIGQFAGVGFAIPINMVRDILPTLVKGEKVTRGMLGVGIKEVTASVAKEFGLSEAKGALVVRVYADSPAAKGGVKLGDVIVRYDGKEVDNTELLREMVGATAPGKEVKLVVIRDGKEETLRVTVAKMTPQMSAAMMPSEEGASALGKLGMSVQTLTPDLAKEFGLQATEGAIITDVQEGSPASLAELERGDLIVEADHQKVANADDLEEALNKAKDKEDVWLRIKRKDAELLVELHVK